MGHLLKEDVAISAKHGWIVWNRILQADVVAVGVPVRVDNMDELQLAVATYRVLLQRILRGPTLPTSPDRDIG